MAAADGTVRVFALDLRWPPEGPEPAAAFATSADGTRTVLARQDLTLEVWDNTEGARIARVPTHAGPASTVAIDGDRVLLASLDGTITLWSLAKGAPAAETSFRVPDGSVTAIAPGAAEDEILLGFLDGAVELWSVRGRRLIARLDGEAGAPVRALRVAEGRVDAWDVAKGQRSWDLASREQVTPSPAAPPSPALAGRAPPHQGPPLPWVARDATWRMIDFENRYGRKLAGAEVVPIPVGEHAPLRPRIDPLSK
jgi:WD40 repeat protein